MIFDPDVDAFRAAWQFAARHEVSAKPDAAILAALDRLATGVRRQVAAGAPVEKAIRPFQLAIAKSEGMTSDPTSLQAWAYKDGNRVLLDVRMGFASSVYAFDGQGKRLTVPPELRWSYRMFGNVFRTGPLLAFNATSLSDAGIRFEYALHWLRRTSKGYVACGYAKGRSRYESSRAYLVEQGSKVTLTSIEEPKSFFTDNASTPIGRRETWISGPTGAHRTKVELLDPLVRAADAWLVAHRPHAERAMLLNSAIGKDWVELEFDREKDSKFRFKFAWRNGRAVVRKVTVS